VVIVAAAAADWINGTGKAVEEDEEWSFLDMLVEPAMLIAYAVVGFIAIVSSIVLWRSSRR